MSFRTLAVGPDTPLRLLVVGAGGMGRAWLRTIADTDEAELAGIVDLDPAIARAAATDVGLADVPIGTDAIDLARTTGAHALVNVTVPQAHHPITTAALFAGLPVLGEKPVASDVAQALSLAAAAEVTGELFMVSQSRRWNPQMAALRDAVRQLGPIGTATTEFFKAVHLPGFREEMDNPLLVDMAIHAFDAAQYLLDAEPVAAYCQAYNPPWSWFAGDANATAVFEMSGGARYVFNGSWCSPGAETSWNGGWRISGARGTALWNGDDDPMFDAEPITTAATPAATPDGGNGIGRALRAFTHALRTGETPSGEVHENLMSLAMVEAAVESARTGQRALLDDVLHRAHAQALQNEQRAEVRDRLASWSSVRNALLEPGVAPTSARIRPGTSVRCSASIGRR
jgi:predicted dehydrogenase